MTLNLDRTTWTRVRFGDVVSNLNETIRDPLSAGIDRVIAMEHLDPGELKITRSGSIEDGTTFTRRVRPGQTLFGKRRAYQRKAAYAEFDAICSGDILTFQANPTKLLPELLPFLVQSDGFYEHALGTSAGSLSPRTNWKDLATYAFDLPPLDEQHRIADLLWAIEHHRATCGEVARLCRRTARMVVSELRQEAPDMVPLGSLASISNGQTFPRSLQGQTEGEYPFFKVSDLDRPGNERWLTTSENRIGEADLQTLRASPFPSGAIVTARVGAALRLERRRMVASPCLVDDNHLVIVAKDVDPLYLWAFLSEYPLSAVRNDGVVPSLNQKTVGAVPVPALDRHSQAVTADAYLRCHDAAVAMETELSANTDMRLRLLQRLFGGLT